MARRHFVASSITLSSKATYLLPTPGPPQIKAFTSYGHLECGPDAYARWADDVPKAGWESLSVEWTFLTLREWGNHE